MADAEALDGAVDLGQEYLQDDQIDQQVQGLVDDEGPPGQAEAAEISVEVEGGVEDAELEAIKARVREMEEEAEKLKEMQNEVEKQMSLTSPTTTGPPSLEDKVETDNRSVYVGNVDYSATAEELEQHFHGCGAINRVTILCDKFSGHPKGFAYVEFADKDSVNLSLSLDDSLFKGRQIKVNIKRTNRPGISTTDRPSRSRGRGRGRSSYYGGGGGGGQFYSGYTPRRSRYRPRRFRHYSPY